MFVTLGRGRQGRGEQCCQRRRGAGDEVAWCRGVPVGVSACRRAARRVLVYEIRGLFTDVNDRRACRRD